MLEHGGNIEMAAQCYGIAETDWIDLSTGINPNGWPVTTIPAEAWQRLPGSTRSLEARACDYFGCHNALAVAGSQAAIQQLPRLRKMRSRVGVISPTYAEHVSAWQNEGHQVMCIASGQVDDHLPGLDVLVVVNPNNPTGEIYPAEVLLSWHQQLQSRGGWLVVDEAFMDCQPVASLASYTSQPGLVVLRSLGKFFGLAGLRCGFVLAETTLLNNLQQQLGPWSVSGPAQYVASQALKAHDWQQQNRQRLQQASQRLRTLLMAHGLMPDGGTHLFQWMTHVEAKYIHESLASRAILTRYFSPRVTGQPSLRVGLPANEFQWQALQQALASLELLPARACRG